MWCNGLLSEQRLEESDLSSQLSCSSCEHDLDSPIPPDGWEIDSAPLVGPTCSAIDCEVVAQVIAPDSSSL